MYLSLVNVSKINERKKANRTHYRGNSDLHIQDQNPPSVQPSTAFLSLSR